MTDEDDTSDMLRAADERVQEALSRARFAEARAAVFETQLRAAHDGHAEHFRHTMKQVDAIEARYALLARNDDLFNKFVGFLTTFLTVMYTVVFVVSGRPADLICAVLWGFALVIRVLMALRFRRPVK